MKDSQISEWAGIGALLVIFLGLIGFFMWRASSLPGQRHVDTSTTEVAQSPEVTAPSATDTSGVSSLPPAHTGTATGSPTQPPSSSSKSSSTTAASSTPMASTPANSSTQYAPPPANLPNQASQATPPPPETGGAPVNPAFSQAAPPQSAQQSRPNQPAADSRTMFATRYRGPRSPIIFPSIHSTPPSRTRSGGAATSASDEEFIPTLRTGAAGRHPVLDVRTQIVSQNGSQAVADVTVRNKTGSYYHLHIARLKPGRGEIISQEPFVLAPEGTLRFRNVVLEDKQIIRFAANSRHEWALFWSLLDALHHRERGAHVSSEAASQVTKSLLNRDAAFAQMFRELGQTITRRRTDEAPELLAKFFDEGDGRLTALRQTLEEADVHLTRSEIAALTKSDEASFFRRIVQRWDDSPEADELRVEWEPARRRGQSGGVSDSW